MTLKEIILSDMDNNLTDLEKARLIYIELGKILSFSTKLQNTNEKEFNRMMFPNIDIENFNFNQVNCIIWSTIYSNLLDEVGIKSKIEGSGHKFVTFTIDDKKWIADGAKGSYDDLARIKNNDETEGFGTSRFPRKNNPDLATIINYEETQDILKEIDEKIGYRNNEMDNLLKFKDFLLKIKNKEFDINKEIEIDEKQNIVTAKLEYLFEKIGQLKDGYYESKDFVRELVTYMLDENEMKQIRGRELKRTNKDLEVDIIQCLYVKDTDSNNYNYYLLAPNKKVRKVEKEEILSLSVFGFGLDEKDSIPGIDYPKKFKLGKISHKEPMFLAKKGKYSKVINNVSDYDIIQSHTIK